MMAAADQERGRWSTSGDMVRGARAVVSGHGQVSLELRRALLEHERRVRLGVRVRPDGPLHELGGRRPRRVVVGHHVGRLHRVGGTVAHHRQGGLAVDGRRPRLVVLARQRGPQIVQGERRSGGVVVLVVLMVSVVPLLLLLEELVVLLLLLLLRLTQLQERAGAAEAGRLGSLAVAAVERAPPGPRQGDRRVGTDVGELERRGGRGTAHAAAPDPAVAAVGHFGRVEHVLRV